MRTNKPETDLDKLQGFPVIFRVQHSTSTTVLADRAAQDDRVDGVILVSEEGGSR